MASSRQSDLFQTDEQSDLFGEDTPTPEYRADPDSVRAELYKILAEARAAQKLPWDPKKVLLYRTIFPQMTNWLHPRPRPAELTKAAFYIASRLEIAMRCGSSSLASPSKGEGGC
jgi:hypothetical protein